MRLTSVSNLFRDINTFKLLDEIEWLRRRLFFERHTPDNLMNLIRSANYDLDGSLAPECFCQWCDKRGGSDQILDADLTSCKFVPFFKNLTDNCGLTVLNLPQVEFGNQGQYKFKQYICGPVVTADCHLVTFNAKEWNAHESWKCITYGERIWKATRVGDPELKKLWFLFKILDPYCYFHEREVLMQRAAAHAQVPLAAGDVVDEDAGNSMDDEAAENSMDDEAAENSGSGMNAIDMTPYLQNVDLIDGAPDCRPFLTAMAGKVVMHVHPLENDKTKREVHRLIRPCVEGFYKRRDFDVSRVLSGNDYHADPYFAVTLSRVEGGLTPENVVGCFLAYWHAYPNNIVEIRFEAVKGDESGLLLSAMHWTVFYMARNDPFIMANLGTVEHSVMIQVHLSTDDSPAVWTKDMLYADYFEDERRDEDELVLQKEVMLC